MKGTLFITGPSGIGKTNLDALFSDEIIRIDPYRLRNSGPRIELNTNSLDYSCTDIFYAHPKLKNDFENIFDIGGDNKVVLDQHIIWYPKFKTLMFKVRSTWQILPLIQETMEPNTTLAKGEIFVPLLLQMVSSNEFSFLGEIFIVLLNPCSKSIIEMTESDLIEFKNITRYNIEKRETEDKISIESRVDSITEELKIWKKLLVSPNINGTIIEYKNWQFPEFIYKTGDSLKILAQAKNCLLGENPKILDFLMK